MEPIHFHSLMLDLVFIFCSFLEGRQKSCSEYNIKLNEQFFFLFHFVFLLITKKALQECYLVYTYVV